ncbi:MAG: DUF4386 domain-containing protein [Dactylosporangium sp.]|nr:DUF4386 domain-containing protein [Dactylosporangium sp.]
MDSPQRLARTAGALYLMVAVFALFAHTTVTSAYVPGDAAATAANVADHATLFRLGFVADLVQAMCMLLTGMALYLLFRHVNRRAAHTMMIFVAVMVAIMLPNMVHRMAALIVATDGSFATALGATGSDTLVLLLLTIHHHGVLIAQIFFGLWLLPLGYLIATSGMLPRVLGVLLMTVGCFGYLIDLLVRFVAPDLGAALGPFLVTPAGIVEFATLLWLLIKGAAAPAARTPPRPVIA